MDSFTQELLSETSSQKKKKGLFFWIVCCVLSLFFLFLLLTSYYIWIAQFGSADQKTKLANTFEAAQFSSILPGINTNNTTIDIPITQLIRPENPRIGNPNAPVKLIAFIDFECPFCRAAYPDFEAVINRYGAAVEIIFKHFPIESIHPLAFDAAMAAQCAHDQDMFFPYYRLLFDEQKMDRLSLKQYAQTLGLDHATFTRCLDTEQHRQTVQNDFNDGLRVEVRGTPTYMLNQKKLEGVTAATHWQEAIIEALQE